MRMRTWITTLLALKCTVDLAGCASRVSATAASPTPEPPDASSRPTEPAGSLPREDVGVVPPDPPD